MIVRVFAEELHTRAGIDELVVSEHDILEAIALGLACSRPRWYGSALRRKRR